MEKRYEEALERARQGLPIDKIFPELYESEDERIRTVLCDIVRDMPYMETELRAHGLSVEKTIAYLERQKEQKPAEWSEEDENALKYFHELIGFGFTEKFFDAHTASDMRLWLNTRLKSLRPQPKQEWSEEDENKLRQVMELLLADKNIALRENPHCKALHRAYEELLDWLKSLRPQPRRKDTYYDIIHNILDTIKDMDFMRITPEHRVSLLNDIRVKCKNADECAAILDEPHWKPSEEQMEALMLAIEGKCAPTSYMSRRLEDLYEALANEFHVECKFDK